jgi:hypothetical protein
MENAASETSVYSQNTTGAVKTSNPVERNVKKLKIAIVSAGTRE